MVDWVVNSGHLKQNSNAGDGGSSGGLISNPKGIGGSGSNNVGQTDDSDSENLSSPVKVVKKKRRDIPAEEKKICLWVLEDGTACGKTFTKFDR